MLTDDELKSHMESTLDKARKKDVEFRVSTRRKKLQPISTGRKEDNQKCELTFEDLLKSRNR